MATEMQAATLFIGCAGWAIPKAQAARFPTDGSHLQRYARRFDAVEINSSFYRPHRPGTYARWAASVPKHFRFSVKLPREITHRRRLRDTEAPLERFLSEAGALGGRLGVLLIQLPPSLPFEAGVAGAFLSALRGRFAGGIACEPRHASWFENAAERLLAEFRVARVAADPPPAPAAAGPAGWSGMVYYRLHGAPRVYYSPYSAEYLDGLARELAAAEAASTPVWCIFDNTAEAAAIPNALSLAERLDGMLPKARSFR